MSSIHAQYDNPQIQQGQFNFAVNNNSLWSIQRGPQKIGDPNPVENNSQSVNSQNQDNFFQRIMNLLRGNSSSQSSGSQNPFARTEAPLNPFSSQTQQKENPDTIARQYAIENGISLEQAKAELRAKYGNPKR